MGSSSDAKSLNRLREIVVAESGIQLGNEKDQLVLTRIGRLLRRLGHETLEAYLAHVETDRTGAARSDLVDAVTTNVTSFFREPHHFQHLAKLAASEWQAERHPEPIRIWSSACSSGQEPYSILMALERQLGEAELRRYLVLATDLSKRMLVRCQRAVYPEREIQPIPPIDRQRWLSPIPGSNSYRVSPALQQRVRFRHLNLLGSWPMKRSFDAIFCRNVLIYFDRPTQERVVKRFHERLAPGGYLYIGHSESLSGFANDFEFIAPTIYRRKSA
ncbi:Chemotaxis protein methyltransferase Cher2 [Planctomycetes bacterium Pla163]|uniref:protein-glutamate O-methyltransferase n=1 Tax=Rohdeia mirabilis TaxID=2528008 RepID=A0A518CVS5_9BACT|nr:Chemotaxis protein methyltransferase Cher2 [Planctomycetes bacterium Pla163]